MACNWTSNAWRRPISGRSPGITFRIDFADIHWRSRSLWDQELPRLPAAGLKGNLQLGPEGQQLLVLRSDYKRFGQSISISVAQDYTPVRESFRPDASDRPGAGGGGLVAGVDPATGHGPSRLAPAGSCAQPDRPAATGPALATRHPGAAGAGTAGGADQPPAGPHRRQPQAFTQCPGQPRPRAENPAVGAVERGVERSAQGSAALAHAAARTA